MLWSKVDKRWQDRLPATSDGDVSWKTEQWAVPGEDTLEVRVCTRKGVELSKFCNTKEAPRTSIVLHLTCGYGNFSGLMGGSDHAASAHFLLGRCGTPYLLVPTEFTSWHATWWNNNSIGIEIDNIGGLHKVGSNMASEYSNKDVYCTADEKDVFLEKKFGGTQYWATLPEAQYKGLGKLLKALCFKHQIPRIILPEAHRYEAFDKKDPKVRANYRGICTHVNIDPARRADIGPYIDWPKVIQYAALTEADCYKPPAAVADSWKDGGSAAPAKSSAPPDPPKPNTPLPPPVVVDSHTIKTVIGTHGGRICLSVKGAGEPLAVTPDKFTAPAAKAPGKRDDFITACMNFQGTPYKAGSTKPADGLDGATLIGLALKRVGVFKSDDEVPADASHLCALWHLTSGDPKDPPDEIQPGDIAWFGRGDHDNDPMQHPMVFLGGGRVLGPVPDGAADKSVQVIAIEDVPEKFAGWMHLDDLGRDSKQTEHPGDPPAPGEKMTGALLPPTPAAQYDALKAVVERAKGKWEDAKGKVNLVGVQNMHDRCLISPKPDDWNDTLFAAFLDDDGHKCVLQLRSSLNPGTDTNKAETWQLWEGSWKFKLTDGDGVQGKALQPDGKVKGWLDVAGLGAPRPLDHSVDPGDSVTPAAPKAKGDDKTPEEKAPLDVPKSAKPAPPVDKPFVFDAAGKKLSVKFGMRMMRALMDWELRDEGGELQGCLYSSNGVVTPYTPRVAGVGVQEWPELSMSIEPLRKTTVDGREYSTWKAFGIEWGGTGATNCCNSQMAAIFAATRDGKMRIKRDSGLLTVDLVNGTPADDIKDRPPDDPKKKIDFGTAFIRCWIGGPSSGLHYKSSGKNLFSDYSLPAPAWAMKYLQVGEPIGKWGDKDALLQIRIGDSGQWAAHNWLVGDVRYEVTLKGCNAPKYIDQSDFVKVERPELKDTDENIDNKIGKDDCTFIEMHEEDFEARVKNFVTAKSWDCEGDKDVVSIKAVKVRVFSANACNYGVYGTNCGKVYKKGDDGTWSVDEGQTQMSRLSLGISRGWVSFAKEKGNWGFARWYDNAGGA